MRRVALLVALLAGLVTPADAYLKLGSDVGGRIVGIRWTTQPIRYFVTNRDVAGVTAPALQAAVGQAFATWAAVPGVAVSSEFVGFTDADPIDGDGMSVIGFRSRPDLERTLGATTFTVDSTTGAVLESDVFLNSAFDWSTAANGTPSRFDVQSIALHEIGHLLGLGHSALGETALAGNGQRRVIAKRAVMFPIAYPPGTTIDRQLDPDDEAGLVDDYGTVNRRARLGSIGGHVRRRGIGLFGAHVTALNTRTGALVGTFSLDGDGTFVLAGLEPGVYVVRAEPLDDADVDSFFDATASVDINFTPAYAPSLAVVQAGAGTSGIDVAVEAK